MLAAGCAATPDSTGASDSKARQAAQINTSLGREYLDRGQYEVALEKLKKAINADPDYAPGHTLIAVLYEQIGEPELAERHYHAAVKASPDNGDVNNNYGVFLCNSGRNPQAEKHFLRALDDPFYTTPQVAYANAGSCMLDSGDLDKAERYLRQSLEYDKDFPDALLTMAGLEFQTGDYLRARAFIQRYEAASTQTAESLLLGMQIESRLHDAAAARDYEARLLARFPNSPQAAVAKSGDRNE
jgi:type IV pilus assembly protein PilF